MINYPNGKKRITTSSTSNKQAYPNKSNLGKSLEDDLNHANTYYRIHQLALVHKKPTPVTIVKVDYPARNKAKIVEAYYQQPSTTDYNGIYQGIPIDFEAKQTKNKTLLPLAMIHPHQLEHLKQVDWHGGIAFLIIRFTHYDETYFIAYKQLEPLLPSHKSLRYDWIKKNGILIKPTFFAYCDYLSALKTYLKKESYDKQKQ